MNPLWWVAWSAICAVGTGLLVYFVMQSRMEVLLSKQREELAGARAALDAQKENLATSMKNVEESTRRVAMDQFLAEIRIEERHYIREHKILFTNRKLLVRQERIFFRNIPLSDWIEREMPLEEGADAEKMARTMSVFAKILLDEPDLPVRKFLR
jgi:hypothetical protein